jgi:hypothetical protein
MCIGNPLKKTGFQKKNGTKPHFKKIENININHGIVRLIISQKLFDIIKYPKTCSIINQSNVKTFKYNCVMNKKRFNEANKDIQKKNNKDCI